MISARQLMSDGFYNHFFAFEGGCLADQSAELLRQFFKARRQNSQVIDPSNQ